VQQDQTRLTLRRTPTEARRARHYVRDLCSGLSVDVTNTAQLLTSELVANAVQHGTGEIELRVTTRDGELHVEVADESPDEPRLLEASPDHSKGRGIMIVDAFSSSWGVTPFEGRPGKAVWFVLPTA
jgi:anti-sigma regulatory factor (Ser/Thr protein kinase)